MDQPLDLETRRLFISATLTVQVRRRLGRHVPAGSGPRELLDLARRLDEVAGSVERAHRLRFEPSYPGVTAGPQDAGRTSKLLLACTVSDQDCFPIGVAFTTLIPCRLPQVSLAPPEASIPEGWRLPADFY